MSARVPRRWWLAGGGAFVRDRTEDEQVRRLAYDVINTQANQRGMLLGRLDTWGLPKASRKPPMAWMRHMEEYEPNDGSLMPGMGVCPAPVCRVGCPRRRDRPGVDSTTNT